ncbi:deoxyribodipyrimidine photo-lyase [Salminus brasiliensis]|uniref:deoxyribodipyrimidine photo-lyase n=1 Tax=Salminus brasiliensis TaxID=930266 RepID=UPI003B835BD1
MSVAKVSEVRSMLRDLLLGLEDAEGFFCLCLSALGERDTLALFLDLIKPLASGHVQLYSQLTTIFMNYFSRDDEEALEVAIALSLHDITHRDEPSKGRSSDQLSERVSENSEAGDPEKPVQKECTLKDIGPQRTTTVMKKEHSPGPSLAADDSAKPKKSRRQRKKQQLTQNPSAPRPVLLWLRRDLRMWDNPALIGCLELGAPIIPVFLWNVTEEEGSGVTMATGGASKYWLHHALVCLNRSLEERGSHLVTQKAEPSSLAALQALVAETGAGAVVATALYEPWLKERDEGVWAGLEKQGVKCHIYHSYCLRDPYTVSTKGVGLRGIGSVSHFMSCCDQNPGPGIGTSLDAPSALPAPSSWPQGCPLTQLELARMPQRKDGTEIDWAANIRKAWDFSEEGAQVRLQTFLRDGVYRYEKESCRADAPNTSSLSPYLHFGQLSARWLLWDARGARCRPRKFQRKLAWRDLAYWQLCLFPHLPWKSLRPPYKDLRWSSDCNHLKAWQRGRTGYPLVDAAMRQLWLTGWLNNYMRHVVASFLIAYLHIAWQEGYRWFQDTLVDADVAIDAMMWQNGGMCGLDHWNFVMHPVDAALTCDPNGNYVRQWCPELKGLPDDLIHKPWKCPGSVLRRAGITLGQTYPERIVVDLEERRAQSLQDVALVRKRYREYVCQQSGCDLMPLPAKLVQEAMGSTNDIVRRGGNEFLLPVITRMEFRLEPEDTDRQANPYSAVLKGYVSRKRDERVAFLNERDFTASVMYENAQRIERLEKNHCILEELQCPPVSKGRGRHRSVRPVSGAAQHR